MKILYCTKYFMSRTEVCGSGIGCLRTPYGLVQFKTRRADAIGPFRATSRSPKSVTASVSGVSRDLSCDGRPEGSSFPDELQANYTAN
jgi:hypothetical protein